MASLFGTLQLGQHSLQVQQQAIEIAGHNIANVNNTAYARQRVNIATSPTLPTPVGPQGTGAQVLSIQQLRSSLLDSQIQIETSVGGFLQTQQQTLQFAQAILGQEIDRAASGSQGSAAAAGVGGQQGLAEQIADLFVTFQSLSTDPASLTERQAVLSQAQSLAQEFQRVDSRLTALQGDLNISLAADASAVNELASAIARLNREIFFTEQKTGTANDLRDLRQQRVEELAKLIDVSTAENPNGMLDVTAGGALLVSGLDVLDRLETYDAGGGQMMVRTQATAVPLSPTSGQMQGTIAARDGVLATLQADLNGLAAELITQVNAIHRPGYSLTGSTGADLFTGSDAASIDVNAALVADPRLLQASGESGAEGDNQVALALAQLAHQAQPNLGGQTFSQRYAQIVAAFGQALDAVNSQLTDQDLVQQLLQRQREALSGVSLDEEMTDMMKFQRAFEASARLVTTVDELLQTVLNLKR